LNWSAGLVLVFALGCTADRALAPESEYQLGVPSTSSRPIVRVSDRDDAPVKGVRVRFRSNQPTVLADSIAVTGVDGTAEARLTAGPQTLTVIVDAWIAAAPGRTVRLTMTRQGTLLPDTLASPCAMPGATLDVGPNQHVTVSAARLSCVLLAGNGATYLVVGQFAAAGTPDSIRWQLNSTTSASAILESTPSFPSNRSESRQVRDELDTRLRALERAVLSQVTPRPRTQLASLASPPTIGSLRAFEVAAKLDGSAFTKVTARLRYAGERLLVYVDTSDSGLSAAQLQALAALFDRQLIGEAERVFGALPDVDGDGRVSVLFTPAVNRLARREDCVFRGFPTGFFYPVDQLERTAHSNRGEIFYAFVPDPVDKYSCTHNEEDVVRLIQATFLHELQHLISFNQRVLARGGQFEDGWLNEGLSQMAEELGSRMFEKRYPAPLGRSSTAQLFPDSAAPFIAPQMLNAYVYLYFQLQHSVTSYVGTGSLEDRGASWLFLRWLADQKGEAVLGRLVQSSQRGIANVEAVTGERFGDLFGDFSLALFADSLPGQPRGTTPARLRFASRNIRQLMARESVIAGFTEPFPIATYQLDRDGALRAAMPRGTMIHALLTSKPGDGPVRLSFRTFVGAPFEASAGAQVSILRLPQ
jgi:hypothetical protein